MKKIIFKTAVIMLFVLTGVCFYTSAARLNTYALLYEKNQLVLTFSILLLIILVSVITVYYFIKIKSVLKQEKMTDTETGAGNLLYYKHHFKTTITDNVRDCYYMAYIVLDSSNLRFYYDNCSIEDVLKYISATLSESVQNNDFYARITESAFAIAYYSESPQSALEKLNIITDKLNNFDENNDYTSKRIFHSALYHLNKNDTDLEYLLFNLRQNCAKITGSEKQIIICDESSINAVQEEKIARENIINGLKNNEFQMYLQFIVNGNSRQIVSAEALSRWISPDKGLIPPLKYIKTMETSGLISKHDFYMFEKACSQLAKWEGTEFGHIIISCNFTRITLSETNFIAKLKSIADNYNFDHSKLAIEITEDSMEKNIETATNNVMKCKDLGFLIYLDDLGSGYTSLANLCDYPIDTVKIDRDILLKTESSKGKELFRGIISLSHNLQLKVISEGIETEEQNDFVKDSECDYIQGWYYSKPISPENYESFIKEHNSKYNI